MKLFSLSRILAAIQDLYDGLRQSELWLTLGWHDIRQRYRRSVAGPFWITISMAMMIGGIGYLSGSVLNQRLDDYLPYLAAGIIVFGFISSLVNEGSNVFIDTSRSILQIKAPFSIYAYQIVWRNLLILLHNITIYGVVAIIFQINPGFVSIPRISWCFCNRAQWFFSYLLAWRPGRSLSRCALDLHQSDAGRFFHVTSVLAAHQYPKSVIRRTQPVLLFPRIRPHAAHGRASSCKDLACDRRHHAWERRRLDPVFCPNSPAHPVLAVRDYNVPN